MSAQNVALLRMAGRLVDVSGRSGQAHFEEQIRGAWSSALADIPRHLAADALLSERFTSQLAAAASKPQHATLLFAMIDDGGKDTIVGEFFQNAEVEQLALLGQNNSDILRLFARVSGAEGEETAEDAGLHAPLLEFGLASIPVPAGEPAAGSAVVTSTHVFPGAWEGPDSPGILRDLVRIHEALTRQGTRKPLVRPGQPEVQLWLASEPASDHVVAAPAELRSAVAAGLTTPNVAAPVVKQEHPRPEPAEDEFKPEAKPQPVAKAAPPAPVEPVVSAIKAEPKPEPAAKTPVPAPVAKVEPAVQKVEPVAPKQEPVRPAAVVPTIEKPKPKPAPAPAFSTPEPQPSSGMNRTMLIAGGGVIVAAIGVGAYFLLGNGKSTPAPEPAPVTISAPSEPVAPTPVGPPLAAPGQNTRTTSAPVPTPTSGEIAKSPASTADSTPVAVPASVSTPAAAQPVTPDKRAAALDALGLDGQAAQEDKKRDALKALTGQ